MLDRNKFKQDVKAFYNQLVALVTAAIGFSNLSKEGVAYALLKCSALIASKTYCPREVFVQLAGNAFDEEDILKSLDVNILEALDKDEQVKTKLN